MKTLEDYYYLVECVVHHYMPDQRVEDIRCAGFLGLVEAFPNRPEDEDKIVPWLVSRIKYAILDFFEHDNLIRIPYRSRERHGLDSIKIVDLFEDDAFMTDDSLPSALADLPVDQTEREIISLLVAGHSYSETAELLGTNAMNVCRRVKGIRAKTTNYFME